MCHEDRANVHCLYGRPVIVTQLAVSVLILDINDRHLPSPSFRSAPVGLYNQGLLLNLCLNFSPRSSYGSLLRNTPGQFHGLVIVAD